MLWALMKNKSALTLLLLGICSIFHDASAAPIDHINWCEWVLSEVEMEAASVMVDMPSTLELVTPSSMPNGSSWFTCDNITNHIDIPEGLNVIRECTCILVCEPLLVV